MNNEFDKIDLVIAGLSLILGMLNLLIVAFVAYRQKQFYDKRIPEGRIFFKSPLLGLEFAQQDERIEFDSLSEVTQYRDIIEVSLKKKPFQIRLSSSNDIEAYYAKSYINEVFIRKLLVQQEDNHLFFKQMFPLGYTGADYPYSSSSIQLHFNIREEEIGHEAGLGIILLDGHSGFSENRILEDSMGKYIGVSTFFDTSIRKGVYPKDWPDSILLIIGAYSESMGGSHGYETEIFKLNFK